MSDWRAANDKRKPARSGISSGGLDAQRLDRYTDVMTTKEKMIQMVQALPEDASVEDAMERLLLLAKVERGLQQANAGELIPHEKVKERMAKWLK
jgi:predicted transcriptional regulator